MEPRVFKNQGCRPGPQATTAHEAMRINQQNGVMKRAVEQTIRKVTNVPSSAYARSKVTWYPTKPDAFGQQWYQTKVRELYVFSHRIDKKAP